MAPDRRVGRHLVGGGDDRPEGGGSVEGLPADPVRLDGLVVAVREVVDTGEARDDGPGLCGVDVPAPLADDDAEFRLVVESLLAGR